jgi:hypothetical protein
LIAFAVKFTDAELPGFTDALVGLRARLKSGAGGGPEDWDPPPPQPAKAIKVRRRKESHDIVEREFVPTRVWCMGLEDPP